MTVLQNKLGRSAVLHVLANTTHTLADLQKAGETVGGAVITGIAWSGNCSILRGANVVWRAPATSANYINFKAQGMVIDIDKTGSLVINVNDVGTGFVMVQVDKTDSVYTSTY